MRTVANLIGGKIMINEQCKKEIKEFLSEYPQPSIVTASTMYDGFVSCIKPINTICGAELICSPKTKSSLLKLIANTKALLAQLEEKGDE